MTKQEYVKCAEKNSELTSILKQNAVLNLAEQKKDTGTKVSKITYVGKHDVYNMEVSDHHNFAVNGGFIVHNCIDASRYAVQLYDGYKEHQKVDIRKTTRKIKNIFG